VSPLHKHTISRLKNKCTKQNQHDELVIKTYNRNEEKFKAIPSQREEHCEVRGASDDPNGKQRNFQKVPNLRVLVLGFDSN
jgi:hypothetical protein